MSTPLNYYDVLNINHDASAVDIVKAYMETKQVFQPDSLAAYSLYSEDELKVIRQQIEEAYAILSDSEKRHKYNNSLQLGTPPRATEPSSQPPVASKSILSLANSKPEGMKAQKSMTHLITSSSHISGALLREIRESQGISLDAIAKLTKISHQYLEAIEKEDRTNFPEAIYLKSFLKQYAAAIGLDAELVLKAYDSLN